MPKYKLSDIDYSKNDNIDINNQLFRNARNNIGENSEAIKDMDYDAKGREKENLQIYGSELINNLNQINYTFEQIETYIFVPSKVVASKDNQIAISDNDKTEVISVTPTTPISVIKAPTQPLKELSEDVLSSGEVMPQLVYPFTRVDFDMDYTVEEYDNFIKSYEDEIERMIDMNLTNTQQYEDINIELNNLKVFRNKEIERRKKNKGLTNNQVDEMILQIEEALAKSKKDTELSKKEQESKVIINGFINDLISGAVDKSEFEKNKKAEQYLDYIYKMAIDLKKEEAAKQTKGSGRYRGGVKVKGTPKPKGRPKKISNVPLSQTETAEAFEPLNEEAKDEEVTNLGLAKRLDKVLVKLSNMGQNTPIPSYLSKTNELITSLIQFIGRTTVLYITRIEKNLNYLNEEQVKLIFEANEALKSNLEMIDSYGNMGGALIKQTLYKQLVKETMGLYKKIDNSIRNYKKLKDFTIFKGAGRNFGTDRMIGGYFIQSDNPFVMDTPTKRFL